MSSVVPTTRQKRTRKGHHQRQASPSRTDVLPSLLEVSTIADALTQVFQFLKPAAQSKLRRSSSTMCKRYDHAVYLEVLPRGQIGSFHDASHDIKGESLLPYCTEVSSWETWCYFPYEPVPRLRCKTSYQGELYNVHFWSKVLPAKRLLLKLRKRQEEEQTATTCTVHQEGSKFSASSVSTNPKEEYPNRHHDDSQRGTKGGGDLATLMALLLPLYEGYYQNFLQKIKEDEEFMGEDLIADDSVDIPPPFSSVLDNQEEKENNEDHNNCKDDDSHRVVTLKENEEKAELSAWAHADLARILVINECSLLQYRLYRNQDYINDWDDIDTLSYMTTEELYQMIYLQNSCRKEEPMVNK